MFFIITYYDTFVMAGNAYRTIFTYFFEKWIIAGFASQARCDFYKKKHR